MSIALNAEIAIVLLMSVSASARACSSFDAAGVALELQEEQGRCQVVEPATGKRHETAIPTPCAAHLGVDRQVRKVQRGEASYFLLESSRPHPDLSDSCITQVQGMSVTRGVVNVSPHAATLASCLPFQWGAKVFTGLWERGSAPAR